MRLQMIDPNLNFKCNSCTKCCDQPWRTVIEPEKVSALDQTDWEADFPALRGRELYRTVRIGKKTVHELGKGEGNRCVFLDTDGLCMIHKKLGYEAKPLMCRQFPFFAASTWDGDYVSANFGCPTIQRREDPPAAKQADEIAAVVPLSSVAYKPDAPLPLTPNLLIPQPAARELRQLLSTIFNDDPNSTLSEQFALALTAFEKAIATPPEELEQHIACGALAAELNPGPLEPFASACDAPMQSRFLFAATLFPDTLPIDSTADLGFFRRMTLVPKLMTLAKMRGVYASRLLDGNVKVDELLDRPADLRLTPEAMPLLRRYLRSRLWQQFPSGTLLPIFSGFHQHILDFNAIMFFARARCLEKDKAEADLSTVEHAVRLVEFHLANQQRLYTQVLKGWLRNALGSLPLAWCSLRMMRCAPSTVPANA